ncbi:FAD-linked oxidoreductase DDB_G0289697 [Rhizoctonia solani AG-1 IB]|uniref:FAD-linked oxidoreductase DDB_G0289697 n=1 Tax=Thanatephorus cucumeris (strain AG1-IB / isolate 7/3/14) TaxID=1108050 RepID=M5BQX5_THACB|nr:FAD-linked oxidoreductase DDB_G0289697 [Rhizoctonia solani AG-1 IB]
MRFTPPPDRSAAKISKARGITTPFNDEFNRTVDYSSTLAPRAQRDGKAHDYQTRDFASENAIPWRSKSTSSGLSPENKGDVMFVLPKRPEDSAVTPEQVQELRKLISLGQIMTRAYGNLYQDAVFNGNLLHALKTPNVVVFPKTVQEIQDTVKFARKHDIKLTVKNGGHSFAGYCLNYGGILINMKNFGAEGITFDLNSTSKTVTIPGGCRWRDVYKCFKDKGHNEMVLGGRCDSVGVSGFTMGGGVSPFSRPYGLGIDSIISFRIVTADGDDITVSHDDTCEKKRNLFWALRGGGGGNFGVLVEFTTKIHDLANDDGMVVYEVLTWDFPEGRLQFTEMIDKLNSNNKTAPENLTIDVLWEEDQGQLIVVYDGSEEDYRKLEDIESLKKFGGKSKFELCKWWKVAVQEQGWSPDSPAFHHHTSFIFGSEALKPDVVSTVDQIMEELRGVLSKHDPNGKAYLIWVQVGGKTLKPGAKDTAFYWRDASYVSYFKLQWKN